MRTAIAALVICCCLPSAHAIDANRAYSIHGMGTLTCENYLKERAARSNRYYMIGGWLDGYVTGVNRFAPDTYDALSFETTELVAELLDNHCKGHPQERLFSVMNGLLTTVREDRIRTSMPRVKIKVGDQESSMYTEVLQRVQRKLAELGLYRGEPEPAFGDRTRQALAQFQQERNMKATGYPDPATLWRLLRQPGAGPEKRSASPAAPK